MEPFSPSSRSSYFSLEAPIKDILKESFECTARVGGNLEQLSSCRPALFALRAAEAQSCAAAGGGAHAEEGTARAVASPSTARLRPRDPERVRADWVWGGPGSAFARARPRRIRGTSAGKRFRSIVSVPGAPRGCPLAPASPRLLSASRRPNPQRFRAIALRSSTRAT